MRYVFLMIGLSAENEKKQTIVFRTCLVKTVLKLGIKEIPSILEIKQNKFIGYKEGK